MRGISNKEIEPILINFDTVYIRSNINYVNGEEFTGWEYDEEQISKDEFIENLQQENELLKVKTKSLELENELLNAQDEELNMAVIDIYEIVLGGI